VSLGQRQAPIPQGPFVHQTLEQWKQGCRETFNIHRVNPRDARYTPDELETLLWMGFDGYTKSNNPKVLAECLDWVVYALARWDDLSQVDSNLGELAVEVAFSMVENVPAVVRSSPALFTGLVQLQKAVWTEMKKLRG
jgi:hypothetical protein